MLALLLVLATSMPPWPATASFPVASPSPDARPLLLVEAAAALARGDGPTCGRLAQEALQGGALPRRETAEAWLLRGKCYVLAGDLDRAERSYAVALRLEPGPVAVDDNAFAAARQALPPPGAALAARAAVLDPALAPGALEVELLADDLLLVRAAVVRPAAGGEEVARFPLEAGKARHKVSGLEEVQAGAELALVLLDKHGNELIEAPVEGLVDGHAPRVITPAAGPARPTVLTTLGATALGAGIVGVVASGIALASLGPTARDEDASAWLVGVGASTGLFLVGAGLVVVDQVDPMSRGPIGG